MGLELVVNFIFNIVLIFFWFDKVIFFNNCKFGFIFFNFCCLFFNNEGIFNNFIILIIVFNK